MPRAEADSLARLLVETTDRTAGPVLLHDRVAELAVENGFAATTDEAQERVEPLLTAICAKIHHLQKAAEINGTPWVVELFGSDDEWVRGSSFPDASLDSATRRVRANRVFVAEAKKEIVSLTPGEFERACTAVLRLVGCTEPHTSPIRDDGGIDFYGQLGLQGRLDKSLPLGGIDSRANVWLIGQAKHYPTRAVQTGALRELIGSVELARTGGAIHSWQGLTLRPFDAVIMLIFTTGMFSSGSQSLLTKSGMLSMDGDQLATLLCDFDLGMASVSSTFDREEFRRALLD